MGSEMCIRDRQKSGYGTLTRLLSLVFGPVPQGEEQLKQQRLDHIRAMLDGMARRDEYGDAEPMPDMLSIPYHPRIALREEVMLREFPDSEMTPAYQQVIDEVCGKATTVAALAEQQAEGQAELQAADILPTPAKKQQPKLPAAPFAQLPVWNWPDPSLTSTDFKPALPAAAVPMLNGLSVSLGIDKKQKSQVLKNLIGFSEVQKNELHIFLVKEKNRITSSNQKDIYGFFILYIQCFMEWLDYWVAQGLVQRDTVLARLFTGELDAYLGTWPQVGLFWDQLARQLEKTQDWDQAEKAYHRAIQCDPDYAPNWNNLGNLLTEHLERYEEAEQAYREAIQRDAQFANPWNGLGHLLKNHLERYEEAEQAYHEAIQRDAQDATPWNGLGNLLQEHLERYDEAEQAYREAIQRDAQFAHPWNGLGNLLKNHLERYDEAEQAYREAIQRNVQLAYPWHSLGNLLIRNPQRYDEAATAFRQEIALEQQNNSLAYLCLAELGLIADRIDWIEEGLTGAQQTVDTTEYRPLLALFKLGHALMTQAPAAVAATQQVLVEQQTGPDDISNIRWNFTDLAPFVDRLVGPQRALYQAWMAAFGADIPDASEPAAAYLVWQQSHRTQNTGHSDA